MIRIYDGLDESGKKRYISYNVVGSKKQAELEAKRIEMKRNGGGLINLSQQSLQSWLEEWLEVWAKQTVQDRTLRDYTFQLSSKVYPVLGSQPLHKLQNDSHSFQKLISNIKEENGARSAQYVHVVLKSALKRAVAKGLIAQNPMDDVSSPRVKSKKARAMDTNEIKSFLITAQVRSGIYYPLFVFMLDSGCRPGEALGLLWSDFENDMRTVRIQRSLERTTGK